MSDDLTTPLDQIEQDAIVRANVLVFVHDGIPKEPATAELREAALAAEYAERLLWKAARKAQGIDDADARRAAIGIDSGPEE